VVIPAKDEEGLIGEIVDAVKPYADEVLVVDGRSRDRTPAIAAEHGARVIQDHGRGKGEALRLSFDAATTDILVFIDADGSHDPRDIPALVAPIRAGEADLVIGSRGKGGSDELHGTLEQFIRYVGSQLIMLAVNYRWNVRLTDSQNGFRAIRRDVAVRLGLTSNLTTIEQEMLMKALKQGYRVARSRATSTSAAGERRRSSSGSSGLPTSGPFCATCFDTQGKARCAASGPRHWAAARSHLTLRLLGRF
jgi:dolichol-phosphate mannosyltransferase